MSSETAIAEVIQLQTEVEVQQDSSVIAKVKSLVISNQEDVEESVKLEKTLKDNLKAIKDGFKPIVAAAHQAHKALKAKENAYCKPVDEAIKKVQVIRNAYFEAEEQKRKEREAERIRLQNEQEEQERIRQADVAEASGDTEGAEAIISGNTPIHTPVPPVSEESTQPKTEGLVVKKTYSGHVDDLMKLVKTIADNRPDLLYLVQPDQSAINKLASAQKENFNVPGIRLDVQTKTHTRT